MHMLLTGKQFSLIDNLSSNFKQVQNKKFYLDFTQFLIKR